MVTAGGMAAPLTAEGRGHLEWLDRRHMQAARQDPNALATYVLRDEQSGDPIYQAPYHLEWQALMTEQSRLLLWGFVESAKTSQLVARILWELGRDPSLRVVVLSRTHGMAAAIARAVSRYIESSVELRRVFPGLRPAPGQPWTQSIMYVDRQDGTIARDPSLRALGVHGSIMGARIDLLIIDDALDYETTSSEERREDFDKWFTSTLEGRLSRRARIWWVGNAWHVDDAMHKRARHPSWAAYRYPVVTPDGSPAWPTVWPEERIEQKRIQVGPIEFARQMMCAARSDEDARFKSAWIQKCLALGEGRSLAHALQSVPAGYRIVTGVDLAVSKKKSADQTAFFTIAISPTGQREVLDVELGRFAGPEIVDRMADIHHRYGGIFIVETNGTQEFLAQFARGQTDIPIKSFNTGANKRSPEFGVESIAVEMSGGKWTIPSERDGSGRLVGKSAGIRAWVGQMLYYDPAAHTGDALMASWFAREGARIPPKKKVRFGTLDLLTR